MENLGDLMPIAVIGVILVIGWVLIRIAFKITSTLFKIGCAFIVLIVIAGLALTYLL